MLQGKYSENKKMSGLIGENSSILLVASFFGLSYGFENKTVREVCEQNGVDTSTFLAIVNFISEDNYEIDNSYDKISIETLITFLRSSHRYFLDFKLPIIRKRLLAAIDATGSAESKLVSKEVFLRFFDDYFEEVNLHMLYEDEIVFPYALNLLEGVKEKEYNIGKFEERHDQIDQKLIELKNILIKYYPVKGNLYLLTDVLLDILSCGEYMAVHNKVEDYVFAPAIEALENKLMEKER